MDLGRIAVRAIVAYLYLLFMARTTGKRVVVQATPFDFVVALILGDLVDDALWAEVSMAKFAAGTGSIIFLDLTVKWIASRSTAFYFLVSGRPSVVLRDGVEDGRALRSEQLNDHDLDGFLRLEGIEDRKDVRLAILELDHKPSVLLEEEAEPAQKQDKASVQEMRE